jgi:hypothetical protein
MAAASIRTAGVFLVLVMILFTYVGGLLLAVGILTLGIGRLRA